MPSAPKRPAHLRRAAPRALTKRDTEVAEFLAQRLANDDIAARLYISVKTVDHHGPEVKVGLASA